MNDKKKKVYDAIFDTVLETNGISSITVGEIAKRAGIGKGSVYMYFTNKEQMICEAINYLIEQLTEKLIDYKPDKSKEFKGVLCDFLKNQISVLGRYSEMFYSAVSAEFFPMLTPDMRTEMVDVVRELKTKYEQKILGILAVGAKEGVISAEHTPFDILAVTQMFISMSGHFVQKDVPVICSDIDEHVAMMYDMTVKMLAGPV